MSKYTPGPWTPIHGHRSGLARGIRAGSVNVINFDGVSRAASEEGQANARLIAAAPDLLEALKDVVQYIDDECPAPVSMGRPIYDEARAAIAKAEGTK